MCGEVDILIRWVTTEKQVCIFLLAFSLQCVFYKISCWPGCETETTHLNTNNQNLPVQLMGLISIDFSEDQSKFARVAGVSPYPLALSSLVASSFIKWNHLLVCCFAKRNVSMFLSLSLLPETRHQFWFWEYDLKWIELIRIRLFSPYMDCILARKACCCCCDHFHPFSFTSEKASELQASRNDKHLSDIKIWEGRAETPVSYLRFK